MAAPDPIIPGRYIPTNQDAPAAAAGAAAAAAVPVPTAGWWGHSQQSQQASFLYLPEQEEEAGSASALRRELERVKRRAYLALRREERKAELFRAKCLEVHSTLSEAHAGAQERIRALEREKDALLAASAAARS